MHKAKEEITVPTQLLSYTQVKHAIRGHLGYECTSYSHFSPRRTQCYNMYTLVLCAKCIHSQCQVKIESKAILTQLKNFLLLNFFLIFFFFPHFLLILPHPGGQFLAYQTLNSRRNNLAHIGLLPYQGVLFECVMHFFKPK